MNTLSIQRLKNYLTEYSLHLEYWTEDDGEGNELLGCREIIEKNKALLSKDDIDYLNAMDDKARSILDNYTGNETFDVIMLRKAVEIAIESLKQAA